MSKIYSIGIKYIKTINSIFIYVFISFTSLNIQHAYADSSQMRCNLNSECRPGFVCVGGIGSYTETDKQTGCCEIILPLRQVCLFHNIITGKFGRAIAALVVISMGLSGIFGKLRFQTLLTFFIGTVCIFGSYQVVYLLTGYKYQMCELVDTSVSPGTCPNDTGSGE
jgi:hypothetical protein